MERKEGVHVMSGCRQWSPLSRALPCIALISLVVSNTAWGYSRWTLISLQQVRRLLASQPPPPPQPSVPRAESLAFTFLLGRFSSFYFLQVRPFRELSGFVIISAGWASQNSSRVRDFRLACSCLFSIIYRVDCKRHGQGSAHATERLDLLQSHS
jgi:hypothetical protein